MRRALLQCHNVGAVCLRARRWRTGVYLGLLLTVVSVAPAVAKEQSARVIRYPEMGSEVDQRNDYFVQMLKLALEKTRGSEGDFQLEPVALNVPQGRILRMLSVGDQVDVLWSMTSRERERYLRPVRIPLTKGLAGYRLLIIRQTDADEFSGIQTAEQLAEQTAGQEEDWPDTQILRHNRLPVTTSGYLALFTMLHRERIDYIPRAMVEPWAELARRPELNLVVAPNLLLHYPSASYFFVQQDNEALAARLERGLEKALADGSFDRLFYGYPGHQIMFHRSNVHQRRILRLENPLLPEKTPLDRKALWWHPDDHDSETLGAEASGTVNGLQ